MISIERTILDSLVDCSFDLINPNPYFFFATPIHLSTAAQFYFPEFEVNGKEYSKEKAVSSVASGWEFSDMHKRINELTVIAFEEMELNPVSVIFIFTLF